MTALARPRSSQIGVLLGDWRRRRRMSQLELALEAGVSTRHLSFLETGRARPSREMVMRLAEHLRVPPRERNHLLLAAGYAPIHHERSLDDPGMEPIRAALKAVLDGHEPNPAIAVDRSWELLSHNRAATLVLDGLPDELLAPPMNVLRASLHPDGLARSIVNLRQWKDHILERLAREALVTGDPALRALYHELDAYPASPAGEPDHGLVGGEVAVPLRLHSCHGELRLLSTVTTFGTAAGTTVEELSIATFLPADAFTADALRRRAAVLTAGVRPSPAHDGPPVVALARDHRDRANGSAGRETGRDAAGEAGAAGDRRVRPVGKIGQPAA